MTTPFPTPYDPRMQNANTYKKIEIVGTSPESISKAVQNGIDRASRTVKNMDWFEVTELRGRIDGGSAAEFQVSMKIGFRLE